MKQYQHKDWTLIHIERQNKVIFANKDHCIQHSIQLDQLTDNVFFTKGSGSSIQASEKPFTCPTNNPVKIFLSETVALLDFQNKQTIMLTRQ